jgi:ribosomal protein S20
MNNAFLDEKRFRDKLNTTWTEWKKHIPRFQSIVHWWEQYAKKMKNHTREKELRETKIETGWKTFTKKLYARSFKNPSARTEGDSVNGTESQIDTLKQCTRLNTNQSDQQSAYQKNLTQSESMNTDL